MQKITIGICSALMALCCVTPLNAVSASNAKENAEKHMQQLKKELQVKFDYTCKGDEEKASCIAKEINIENFVLQDFRIALHSKNHSYEYLTSFDVGLKSGNEVPKDLVGLVPQKVVCKSDSALKRVVLSTNARCAVQADKYSLKFGAKVDTESKEFGGKSVSEVLDILTQDGEKFNEVAGDMVAVEKILGKYRIDPKELRIEIKGKNLGDEMLKIIKLEDPDYKKEQYVATINMGASMVAVVLGGIDGIPELTINQASDAVSALGDLLTSEKEYLHVTFRRKNSVLLSLSDGFTSIINEVNSSPANLLRYLSDYDITVKSY